MKQAIIDIGSNSMRLTLYETDGVGFKILFREKIMAGLAGYVENGALSSEGIECAYTGLLDFRETLESLDIGNTVVFATASLRNIANTEEAVTAIRVATGYQVEVISGEEEALYGYVGAMLEVNPTSGAYIDIGGASTETVAFEGGKPSALTSYQVGSLSLYREYVKKILPGEGSLKRMMKRISAELDRKGSFAFDRRSPLVCVGGTARTVMKLAVRLYDLPAGCRSVGKAQFEELCSLLYRGDRAASDLVLKLEPDRIHTIVPGVMILQQIFRRFESDELLVSKYGVREGYLCERILRTSHADMPIRRTGN